MVSSKWIQVESPSPLRFLAALMPPWAQTEWERFTGTMENRSTSPPISAILMTAERPARPPPTTMILGAAMLYESFSVARRSLLVVGKPYLARAFGDFDSPTCIANDERLSTALLCFPNLNLSRAAAAAPSGSRTC